MRENKIGKPCRIGDSGKLGQVLHRCWDRLQRKHPVFIVVTGRVGTGKSRSIFMNIIDYWYKTFHNKIPPKTCFGVTFPKYIDALNVAKPNEIAGLDEGGDVFSKGRQGQASLKDLYETYGIIRERCIFTIIVMPSIFDLESKFAMNSVTYWINTIKRVDNKCNNCGKSFVDYKCPFCNSTSYKEGFVGFKFYSQKRLKDILRYNETRQIKTLKVPNIRANFDGIINEYKGELVSYYSELKNKKTTGKVEMLKKKYGLEAENKRKEQTKKIVELLDQGLTLTEVSDKIGLHENTIKSRIQQYV